MSAEHSKCAAQLQQRHPWIPTGRTGHRPVRTRRRSGTKAATASAGARAPPVHLRTPTPPCPLSSTRPQGPAPARAAALLSHSPVQPARRSPAPPATHGPAPLLILGRRQLVSWHFSNRQAHVRDFPTTRTVARQHCEYFSLDFLPILWLIPQSRNLDSRIEDDPWLFDASKEYCHHFSLPKRKS
jgi:hypothetical protein